MALHAEPHTNHKYLTHEQLDQLVDDRDERLNKWKLKALNLARRVASVMRKLDDHRRFLMAVATGDVPRLQQLVKQGLKNHASIPAIIHKIEEACSGVYNARGYNATDFDMALMVLRLGGRKLLYALNHHIALPSLRALRRAHIFIKLMPSVGTPSVGEILFNIRSIFGPKVSGLDPVRPYRSGMSVLWDEVNEENAACYIEHLDSVGGLCREHSCHVNLRLKTYENALSLAAALADGDVHYGKEASVVAMASYGTILRGAFPVLVSPTCKQETPKESAALLQKVLDAWSEGGEASFGPVWSFASDGDAGRRAMVYDMFVKYPVGEDHALYKYVRRLPGLNLMVGDKSITGTFDWKHEIKRWARLLRTLEGTLVQRTVVNHEMLRRHLLRAGRSEDEVNILMNPGDSQDVPRAIDLINAISTIPSTPAPGDPPFDPFELQELSIIALIGDLVSSFMNAFIMPHWTLSEQVASLSKYAHIAFVLFRDNRVNFMPYQLYGDTQTTVKDIIFTIAKQQDMDGTQPFYLFWTGDDRLEVLFGLLRMMGGHNPNFTFTQLLDRLAAAMELDGVLTRHPELNQGHRRLKVTRTEKVDHLNPESWVNDVIAGNVDLPSCWRKGRDAAITSLAKIGIHPDFQVLFDDERVLDMLKPFGDGKYPGVSNEPDRSEHSEDTEDAAPPGDTDEDDRVVLNDMTEDVTPGDSETPGIVLSTAGTVPGSGTYLSDHSQTTSQPLFVAPERTQQPDLETDVAEHDSVDILSLEDALETQEEHMLPTLLPASERTPWLYRNGIDGERIHKTTACARLITIAFARKSHERIWRVRNYTSDVKPRKYSSDDIVDSEAFLLNDLYATLIRCNTTVSLAVLKCVAITQKGIRVDAVKVQSLAHAASSIHLTGQIMDLRPVSGSDTQPGDSHDIVSESAPSNTGSTGASGDTDRYWSWNGSFVKLALDAANPSPLGKAARKTVVIKVASHWCEPINPDIVKTYTGDAPSPATTSTYASPLTWQLFEGDMDIIIAKLWDAVQQGNALKTLPHFQINDEFPYRDHIRGTLSLLCEEGSQILEAEQAARSVTGGGSAGTFQCYQCHRKMDPKKARSHVGEHILRKLRNVEEVLHQPVADSFPCGFCGRSGLRGCDEVFLTKGNNPQALSHCPHFEKFQYRRAQQSSDTSPSTNVPILCSIPGCTGTVGQHLTAVWKYNMPEHIRVAHPGHSVGGYEDGAPLPDDLVRNMFIALDEERRIKIPDAKIPFKSIPAPLSASQSKGVKRNRTEAQRL
ncbi:hypothetical protein BV25DRAFT_1911795 [Artomyces pyxidatus]|uniref:Uncharacterized protein n=1 Tax=Artomyces pyxidatus TaxID=48021 RepID=A0ACB8THP2_9AGAM|nr:hypothetical protein BV25DRAFT_1911795 [Artomyces pyxidatus]